MSIQSPVLPMQESTISLTHRYAEHSGKRLDVVTRIEVLPTSAAEFVAYLVIVDGQADFETDDFIEAVEFYNKALVPESLTTELRASFGDLETQLAGMKNGEEKVLAGKRLQEAKVLFSALKLDT